MRIENKFCVFSYFRAHLDGGKKKGEWRRVE